MILKSVIYTPKEDEHPQPFHIGVPPGSKLSVTRERLVLIWTPVTDRCCVTCCATGVQNWTRERLAELGGMARRKRAKTREVSSALYSLFFHQAFFRDFFDDDDDDDE